MTFWLIIAFMCGAELIFEGSVHLANYLAANEDWMNSG